MVPIKLNVWKNFNSWQIQCKLFAKRKMRGKSIYNGLVKSLLLSFHLLIILLYPLFQEGLTIVENKTADIISETRKLNIRRKANNPDAQNQTTRSTNLWQPTQMQTDHETQLKASRDVRCQMCIIRSCRQYSAMLVGFLDKLTRSCASDENECLKM